MERQISAGVGHFEGMRGEKEFSTEGRTLNSLDVQGMKGSRDYDILQNRGKLMARGPQKEDQGHSEWMKKPGL